MFGLWLVWQVWSAVVAAAANGAPPDTHAAEATAVATAMQAVVASGATPTEMDAEVPKNVRPLLQRVRDAARALVAADVAELAPDANPDALAKRLEAQLTRAGIYVGEPTEDAPAKGLSPAWGRVAAIAAATPPTSGGRLVVDIAWGMPCGADTTSWIYEPNDGHWTLVLADESPGFDADNHALTVVGTGTPGDFYAFAASTPVWCTSVWSQLRYAVLAPGKTPLAPTRRFHGEASANRTCGSVQDIVPERDALSFRYVGMKPDDPATPVLFEVKLRIANGAVTRVGKDHVVPGEPCPE